MATRLDKYKTLNTVIPYFNTTKYPYNVITPKKITFTQQEIDLVYQHDEQFFVTESKFKKKRGGNEKIEVLLYDIFD